MACSEYTTYQDNVCRTMQVILILTVWSSFLFNRADRMRMEELKLQCQEFQSLYQAATVERDKLSELVQVLQQRYQVHAFVMYLSAS